MRRMLVFLMLTATVIVATGPVSATSEWHATASPMSIQAGVSSAVAVRATNTGDSGDIGCVMLDTGPKFTVLGATVIGTTADSAWSATTLSSTDVLVGNVDGNGKLHRGDWVEFRVTVRGDAPGSYSWVLNGYQNSDCSSSPFLPPFALGMTVRPGQTPPPTPTPPPSPPAATPRPPAATPGPTPPPTPGQSTPRPSANTSVPSASAAPPASVTSAPSSAGADPTPRPEPSSTPSAPDDGSGAGDSGPGRSSTPSATNQPTNGERGGRTTNGTTSAGGSVTFAIPDVAGPANGVIGLGLEVFDLLEGTHIWFVPAMTLGVPGLLVILWVALQTVGILAWLPAVRRMRGDRTPAPGLRS